MLVMFATSAASSALIAAIENAPSHWPALGDLLTGLSAGWVVMAMWVSLGVMLGALLRSMALPIGLGVVWILGVENLVSAVAGTTLSALQPLRDVLPGVNAGSLISAVLPATPAPSLQASRTPSAAPAGCSPSWPISSSPPRYSSWALADET